MHKRHEMDKILVGGLLPDSLSEMGGRVSPRAVAGGTRFVASVLRRVALVATALCAAAAFADLPPGYRQLDYVDTDGSTWVNTLFTPDCTNAVEFKAAVPASDVMVVLYCSRKAMTGSDRRTYSLALNINGTPRFDYRNSTWSPSHPVTDGVPHTFCVYPYPEDWYAISCTIDGEQVGYYKPQNENPFTPEANAHFCLFGAYTGELNDSTTVSSLATYRFYHFKVWDTKEKENLVCHIIPVYGETEHAVGLYDLVAGRFLPAHGGTLAAPKVVLSDLELSENEDWTSVPVMIADGATVDLNGHDLAVASVGTNAVSALNPYYQDIGYITATGGEVIHIDGFKLPGAAKVETKFRPALVSGSQFLFSSRTQAKSNAYSALITGSAIRFDFNDKQTYSNTILTNEVDYTAVFDGTTPKPTWSVNGVAEKTHTATSNEFMGGSDLCIFERTTAQTSNLFTGRLYYFIVITNGVTAYDLRPVRRISDGAVGLYDRVGNGFYPSGTATAVHAPADVPKFTNSCETASVLNVGQGLIPGYTVVDRIFSTTKGARIDTGYVPVSTDRMEMRTCYSQDPATLFFFCSRTQMKGATDQFSVLLTANALRFDFRGTQYYYYKADHTTKFPDRDEPFTVAIDGNAKSCYFDGEFAYEYSRNDFTSTANLVLFASHENGNNFNNHPIGSIYWFKVTGADGTLKIDMVPVLRNQDSVAGLYDRVRHKFYPSASETAFTAGTQVGDGKLYVDVDGTFVGSEIAGNITLVKKGESAFDGGGLSLSTTLKPEAGTVAGVTLTDGATLDLSAFSETFNLDENAISFANGASITIALGSRNVSSKTPLVSWTTAPANVGTQAFLGEDGRRLTVKDDGVYLPRKGLMMIVR